MPPLKDKWIRRFVINETTRHKEGFTIYKVSSVIFLKSSPDTASKVSVWKRYNDLKKLHAALKLLHGTLKIKEPFPSFAKPKFFGRFEAEVVDERRECAVKFLEFVAKHASLFTSDVFVKFFETSLGDNCTAADCSQSISSDTSEDDKSTIVENSTRQEIKVETHENSSHDSSIDRDITKTNSADKQIVPIANNNDDSSDDQNSKTESQSQNNNNNNKKKKKNNNNNNSSDKEDKFSNDLSWQRFLSVEKLVEDGRNDCFLQQQQQQHSSISPTTVHDGLDFARSDSAQDYSGQYILIAAAHISAGFRHEAIAEYEEAFMQYKLGIATLRHGVEKDLDIARRATIIDKIIKYSERADRLYNRHLNCNISMISKPVSELQYYKVLRVMGSVMLVKDLHQESTKVIKTVEKPAGFQEDISKYILRGKVPHMVQLHACIQTETTVFLILQYASGGLLWDFLKKSYAVPSRKQRLSRKKSYTRSMSCEAIIHVNPERRTTTSRERQNVETEISSFLEGQNSKMNPENCPEDSLAKLEEEFGANSIYNRDLPTTELLEKAQQLLKSVDATIKKSNSIASRLDDFGRYTAEYKNGVAKNLDNCENTEDVSCDLSELSMSDSCTDLSSSSSGSDKGVVRANECHLIFRQLPLRGMHELQKKMLGKDETTAMTNDETLVSVKSSERFHHDEDSGIEMEQELWRVPEAILRCWTAQMLLALEALHQQNVIIADLRPDNILVTEDSRVLLSYVVPRQRAEFSKYQKPYTAPELCMYSAVLPATPAADVWSIGVLLYEMFTGIPFQSRHPGPFHSHSIISIPNDLSDAAKSLLTKVLRFEPTERLTIPEIKQLPFFERIDWLGLLNS